MNKYAGLRGYQGSKGRFQIVIPDIDGFIDEQVVQGDVQVVENTFIDDSK